MTVPKNVIWFEVLLYLALTLDAISVAVQDHTPTAAAPWQVVLANSVLAICIILIQVYFVHLASRERKNWPRLALLAVLLVTMVSLILDFSRYGGTLNWSIEVASCVLASIGLILSFCGGAAQWFDR